jgi:hypothetical protein
MRRLRQDAGSEPGRRAGDGSSATEVDALHPRPRMDGGEHPHREAPQPPELDPDVQDVPQRTAQGRQGDAEGGDDSAPRAGGTRSGPGRANREDDKHKPTSRRNNVTRMSTALIITTILVGIVAIALLAAGCAT